MFCLTAAMIYNIYMQHIPYDKNIMMDFSRSCLYWLVKVIIIVRKPPKKRHIVTIVMGRLALLFFHTYSYILPAATPFVGMGIGVAKLASVATNHNNYSLNTFINKYPLFNYGEKIFTNSVHCKCYGYDVMVNQ